MSVLIRPEWMAPDLRRYIAHNGHTFISKPFNKQPFTGQQSALAGNVAASPEYNGPDHAPQKS